MFTKIAVASQNETILLAADELKRYLTLIDNTAEVSITQMCDYDPSLKDTLWLLDDYELLPSVKDSTRDDAIVIDITDYHGIIAGTNPRAVLIAVYRFLRELGCNWIRPGNGGEFLPSFLPENIKVTLSETPSYRHRGICIEGAVSYDHVINMIEWIPKVGMNCYFNQFFVPFAFFDRWYGHHKNPLLTPHNVTRAEAEGMVRRQEREVERRGLMYHAVGHGWTCEPFGIEGLGWDTSVYGIPEVSPETEACLALVNGKRELSDGIPLNTQLCYSQELVRERITDAIRDHCAAHPEIDYVHFWLGDGMNNHCECSGCKDTLPSDYYVLMLNELDKKLTASNIKTRVVFLIYVDLLWPPQKERIVNPDRFTLMFAPITRTYSSAYTVDKDKCTGTLPPFERNKLKMPRSVEDNVAFLKSWQDMFGGDSFIFEYHFMWDHFHDPGYTDIARVLRDDIAGLEDIGLGGMVSCLSFRVFFPSGLPMNIMARTMWDKSVTYEDYSKEFCKTSFGDDWKCALEYTEGMTRLFDPVYIRGEKERDNPAQAERLAEVQTFVMDFAPCVERNIKNAQNESLKSSWEYLRLHGEYCILLAAAWETHARGGDLKVGFEKVCEWARKNEPAISDVFDLYELHATYEWFVFKKHF
jgi:hypothetical protein